jgi:hypothetical protein
VIACGGVRPHSTSPAASPEAGTPTMPGDPRSEIAQLEAELDAAAAQLELPAPTPMAADAVPPAEAMATPVPRADDPACRPSPSETCQTSCTLSDSICTNATRICKLADQLAPDTWAAQRCASANERCTASRARCCGCT